MVLQFGDGFFGLLYLVLNGVFKFFCSKALFLKRYAFFLFTRVIMMTFLWTRFARFLDLAPFSLIVGVWSFLVYSFGLCGVAVFSLSIVSLSISL